MEMKSSFSMPIDYVFYQWGIFVVGQVKNGSIKLGDKVKVLGNNSELDNLCISLRKYERHFTRPSDKDIVPRVQVSEAKEGDYVCIGLLQGSKLQIRSGMILVDRDQS